MNIDSAINNLDFSGATQNLVLGRNQKRYEISIIKMFFKKLQPSGLLALLSKECLFNKMNKIIC